MQSVDYIAGEHVQDFAAMDRDIYQRSLIKQPTYSRVWLAVSEHQQQFVIAPNSFLELVDYASRFQPECAPYPFKLRVDGSMTISSTFIAPN